MLKIQVMAALLREVEIIGFKSFAERVRFEFAPGITAVVGPNGCGKSNIVEAIRWVLGEQVAGWLRSKTMTDVIFNGTPNRHGLGMAEVTLRLNNPKPQNEAGPVGLKSQSAIGHLPSTLGHSPSEISHLPSDIGHPGYPRSGCAIRNPQSEIYHQSSAIGNPSSDIGHSPSAIGHSPSAIGHLPSAIGNPQSAIPGTHGVGAPSEIENLVEIKRRLFRSGEGEYFLNNRPCRLKDIQEIILDTGLSETGYFLIEQGRVDSILRSKPVERRHIFEEAAGVKVYQNKKIEAGARLALAEQNLLRLNDILSEIERQEKSLARQVKRAERYKSLKSKIRELEIKLNTARYHYLKRKEAELVHKIDHLKGKVAEIEKDTTGLEAALAEESDRREKSKSLLFKFRESITEDKEKRHQLEKFILGSKERLSSWQEKAKETQARIEYLQRSVKKNEEQAFNQKREGERLKEELQKNQLNLAEIEEALSQAEEGIAGESRQLEEAKSVLIDYLNETAGIKHELVNLSKEEKRKKGEAEVVLQRRIKEGNRHQELTQKIVGLKERVQIKEDKIKQSRGRIADLKKEREGVSEELCKLEREVNSLKVQLEAGYAKIKTFRELEKSLVGYSEGTKAVLKADFPGVRGLMADFISVPAEYETALEAVLDRALEAVVVETTEQAANILNYLEEKGRVTLFVLDKIPLEGGFRMAHPLPGYPRWGNDEGIIGWLRGLVKVDSEYQGLMDFLLADVLLIQNTMPVAEVFRKIGDFTPPTTDLLPSTVCSFDEPPFLIPGTHQVGAQSALGRLVTLDGTVITPWGMIQGGKGKSKETGLLARRRIINELEVAIDKIKGHLHIGEQERKEVAAALDELDKELRITQAGLKAAEMEKVALDKDVEASENLLTACISHLDQLVIEQRELTHEVEVLISQREGLTRQCEAREQEGKKQEAIIRERQQELDRRQKELKEKRESLNQAKISLAVLTQQSQEVEKSISRLNNEKEQLEGSLRELSGREMNLKEAQEREEVSLLRRQEELMALVEEISGKEAAIDQQEQAKKVLDQRCRQIENELNLLRKKGLSIKDALHSLDLERAKVEVEASSINGQLINELGANPVADGVTTSWVPGMAELNTDQSELCHLPSEEIEELKTKLAGLGEVNLAAPGEYEELIKRRDFLLNQKDDLVKAQADLRELISRIDRTSKEQFLTTFLAIRNNFSEIFKRLFDGGDAKILLTDDEEPLEAGVEFFVQPKGKKLSHISLLSGGERSLTSIAFLFALFMIKPSPFCLLDEIDAALDEANISRFIRLLREFAKKTQFIVVTHNRLTMEAANCLYGITMEEPGVSKLVSVQLERAVI
ncbi:MAG: AAA family ATPase [bacterium]